MRNNKLTRKKALAKQPKVTVAPDGTEVLHTKEARQKNRRWSFEADIQITIPGKLDKETGEMSKSVEMPERTLKLDAVSYSTAKEVKGDCHRHEADLRNTNSFFATAKIKVRAVPHETVSNETMRQLTGYRDMAAILDKALGMAIEQAAQVVQGKAVGSQFIEQPEKPAEGDNKAVPARTLSTIKEEFYKNAMDTLRPKEQPNEGTDTTETGRGEATVSTTETDMEGTDGSKPFIPEVIEIQRAEEKPFEGEL